MMRKTVAHIAQPSLFYILFDRIERFFLGDLHLCVGPAGNLDDHVEDAVVLVGKEGDVVKGGNEGTILFDEDSVVCKKAEINEYDGKLAD